MNFEDYDGLDLERGSTVGIPQYFDRASEVKGQVCQGILSRGYDYLETEYKDSCGLVWLIRVV